MPPAHGIPSSLPSSELPASLQRVNARVTRVCATFAASFSPDGNAWHRQGASRNHMFSAHTHVHATHSFFWRESSLSAQPRARVSVSTPTATHTTAARDCARVGSAPGPGPVRVCLAVPQRTPAPPRTRHGHTRASVRCRLHRPQSPCPKTPRREGHDTHARDILIPFDSSLVVACLSTHRVTVSSCTTVRCRCAQVSAREHA